MFSSQAATLPSAANLYRSIWRFAAGMRATMLFTVVLLAGSTVVRLAVPWLTAQAINALQQDGSDSGVRAGLWVAAIAAIHFLAWALHGPGRILERGVGIRVRQG